MNMIRAPNTKFSVMPARSKVNAGNVLPVRAMKNTRSMVTNAPVNAATEIQGIPQIAVSNPNQIATTAPNELPADTPRVNGSAKEFRDRKSTRLNSSHSQISYAVFCLKKKKQKDK